MRPTGRLALASVAVIAVLAITAWGVLGKSSGRSSANNVRQTGASPTATASASPSPSQSSVISGGGWKLKFSAGFTRPRLDTKVWGTCYPWRDLRSGCTNYGNPEYQWYLPAQDRVSQGAMELIAQRVPTQGRNKRGGPMMYGCRSGLVTTYPSLRFTYGYLQIVAKIPESYGLWPALWLAAADRSWPPEIDLLERWGAAPNTDLFFHPVGAHRVAQKAYVGNLSVGWHTFGLLWSSKQLVWYIDGRELLTVDKNIPNIPMYFIANVAEARPVTATQGCDGTMYIQSVKLWQQ